MDTFSAHECLPLHVSYDAVYAHCSVDSSVAQRSRVKLIHVLIVDISSFMLLFLPYARILVSSMLWVCGYEQSVYLLP